MGSTIDYLFLAIAIVAEVIGTSALKATGGFTKLGPSLLVVVAYSTSFYSLTRTLDGIPVGIVYATWSGAGIVLIAFIAFVIYKQSLDVAAIAGIALIIIGVVVMNVFSKVKVH
jgi:small multidrug resistance pump